MNLEGEWNKDSLNWYSEKTKQDNANFTVETKRNCLIFGWFCTQNDQCGNCIDRKGVGKKKCKKLCLEAVARVQARR